MEIFNKNVSILGDLTLSLSNSVGEIITINGSGKANKRTYAEIRSDINAEPQSINLTGKTISLDQSGGSFDVPNIFNQDLNTTDTVSFLNLSGTNTGDQDLDAILNSTMTGLSQGGELTINSDTAKFDIAAGFGTKVDGRTDIDSPTSVPISWNAITGISPQFLATHNASYVSINSSGGILQTSSPLTSTQRRNNIRLGLIVHPNKTTIFITNNQPTVHIEMGGQVQDILDVLGFRSISGNRILPATSTGMKLKKENGTVFKPGANFDTLNSQPHFFNLTLQNPATFRYRLQNGDEGLDVTDIDPTKYDLNGSLTAIPATATLASVQQIYVFQENNIRIQPGQKYYNNLTEAVLGINSASFNTEENIAANGLYLGSIAMIYGTTDLDNILQAVFVPSQGTTTNGSTTLPPLGYTPEDEDNKSQTVTASSLKYPSNNAVILLDNENVKLTGDQSLGTGVKTFTDEVLAITQANAVNNTSVATTAYVKNLIGELPAGLSFEGTWNANSDNPDLSSLTPGNGQFWIVSTNGNTDLSGETDWKVGDWAIYVEDGNGSDGWQKVDNSSVLDGQGVGQKLALWSGSGDSNTLEEAPITVSGNDVTFIGATTVLNPFRVTTNSTFLALSTDASSKVVAMIDSSGNSDTGGLAIKTGDDNFDESALYILNHLESPVFKIKATSGNLESLGSISATQGTFTNGNIVLEGTGRIQGIDTITDATDAVNKNYVDTLDTGVTQITTSGGIFGGTITGVGNLYLQYSNNIGNSNSTTVVRTSSGHIYANYLNSTGSFSTSGQNSGMSIFTGTNGGDTFARSYSASAARTLLNVEDGASVNQSLNISGHTISLTNGGSVTVPDNNTQLNDSDILAFGYIKTDDSRLSDARTPLSHTHPYLPLAGGTITGVININTSTNTDTLNISRIGSNSDQVVKIGLDDTSVVFNYIEDTSSEGSGNFGSYQFKLGGNDGETTVTPFIISKEGISAIDGVFSGDVSLLDNKKAKFGTGNDLSIFHSAGNSSIENNTGILTIKNTSNDIHLASSNNAVIFVNTSDAGVSAIAGGGVNLYHNNVSKLTTTATGATVTGDLGSTTLTPTALTTGTIPYKSAGALLDSPISTDGTDVTISGSVEIGSDAKIARTAGGYTFLENAGGGLRASMKSSSSNNLIFSTGASTQALTLNGVNQSATFASTVSASGTGATIKALNSSLGNSENISIAVGKELSSQNSGFLVWNNNASAGARYLSLETFGGNSPIQISASNFDINTAGAAIFNSTVSATDGLFNGDLLLKSNDVYSSIPSREIYSNFKYNSSGNTTKMNSILFSKNNANSDTGAFTSFSKKPNGQNISEAMRISPDGNLLINTETDNGTDKLQVNGSISATDGLFSGELGIGVANPDTPLHTYSATGNVIATFESGDSNAFINIKDNASGVNGVIFGAIGNDFIVAPNYVEGLRIKENLSAIFTSSVLARKINIAPIAQNGEVDGLNVSYNDDGASNRIRAQLYIDAFNGRLDLTNSADAVSTRINSNGASYLNGGNTLFGTTTDNGTDKVQVNGSVSATDGLFSGGVIVDTSSDSRFRAYLNGVNTLQAQAVSGAARFAAVGNSTNLELHTNGSARLTIDVAGAATFTSSVSATEGTIRKDVSGGIGGTLNIFNRFNANASNHSALLNFGLGNGGDDGYRLLVEAQSNYGNDADLIFQNSSNGTITEALRLKSNLLAEFASSVIVGSNSSTETRFLEIGKGRTGNGTSFIDLISDATYTDYGLRIIRNNAGSNAESEIIHRGTGNFEIKANDSASMLFKTNNTTVLTLNSDQSATFNSTVTATNFILSSDERLKTKIKKVDNKHIKANWKTFEIKSEKDQKRYGVIAQELEKTNPEFVRTDSKGFKSVAYIDLLIAKIAELETRIVKGEKDSSVLIKLLTTKIDLLEARLEKAGI
ncbi:tail fiber domain-containing protein [Clostridium sp.]|jgi:hypothetical protein|uniref:tail fiber domain-containing protein n=1 Tax=Clostridium sp. TaxID=1506 RepID=UPI003EE8AA2D